MDSWCPDVEGEDTLIGLFLGKRTDLLRERQFDSNGMGEGDSQDWGVPRQESLGNFQYERLRGYSKMIGIDPGTLGPIIKTNLSQLAKSKSLVGIKQEVKIIPQSEGRIALELGASPFYDYHR